METLKYLMLVISFIIKKNPVKAFASTLAGTVAIIFSACLFGLAAYLISLSALHPGFELLMLPVVGVRFFGIGRAAFRYVERLISHDATFTFLRDLRYELFNTLEPKLPGDHRKGVLASNIISDVEVLQEAFLRIAYPISVSFLTFITGFIFLMLFSYQLSIVFIVIYLFSSIVVPLFIDRLSKTSFKISANLKEKLYTNFMDFSYGIGDILTNKWGNVWLKRLNSLSEADTVESMKGNLSSTITNSASVLLPNIMLFFMLLASAEFSSSHKIPGTLVAAFPLFCAALMEACLPLYGMGSRIKKTAVSAKRIYDLFLNKDINSDNINNQKDLTNASENRFHTLSNTKSLSDNILEIDRVHLANVSFSYISQKQIIRDLSLEIKKGEVFGLVGKSGAGKSTFINLLTGFLKDYSGVVTIGDTDIQSLPHEELLRYFSVVEQKPYLFNTTLRENLLLGNYVKDDANLEAALKSAGIFEKVNTLPKGLNTFVDELGKNFSAGELQRFSIARAILKDAQIYIFDEPTANLDLENERQIFEIIKNLSKDKIVIVVTHRNPGEGYFDRILKL